MTILNAGRLFLLFAMLILGVQSAQANINGVYGVDGRRSGNTCVDSNTWYAWTFSSENYKLMSSCSITTNSYVPKNGNYQVEFIVFNGISNQVLVDARSAFFYVDATKTIAQQSIQALSSATDSYSGSSNGTIICMYLVDDANHKYTPTSGTGCSGGGGGGSSVLPPTPPEPETSCTINNGNALNVNLSTIDRAQLPTTPGSGAMQHIQIPVECTGGDVTVNMQLNYTPITIGSNQIVKSTANGLGVSVVYGNNVLSSSDVTPVTFLAGSNTVDLAFQAVRDPVVAIKDVPTGSFTASAVLVMTQQ